ncbi:hypothetical protein B7494_g4248 [Chlorociboria aeruginascens]|nr:hypothetical protein B7494_g4248 [Chlorociboria aeruginascens]
MQLEDWLDDLCVRFIINLPQDDLSTVPRICFHIEEAQWFYEDFIRPQNPSLPSLNLRDFFRRISTHCPILQAISKDNDTFTQAFEEFLQYKARIPVRGAIMLNEAMDAVVLVKGWKKGANWSFPRGKINKDEDDLTCAAREVYEETGYDLEGLIPKDRQVKYIEINMREQQMRLYVFRDVPMDTHFEPRTRKEISKIQWWRLSDLPAFRRKGQNQAPEVATSANKFYMVAPFLVPLKKWVVQQKRETRTASNQYLSTGLSHDEFMTEEDQGAESSTQIPNYVSRGPDSQTLADASAALSRLLKIQPPTQGIQGDSMLGQSPVKSSGQALLALLHSKPSTSIPSNAPPHTPLDHTTTQPPIPETPHHQYPRPPHLSSLPPPPTFPIQLPNNSYTYQESNYQGRHNGNGFQQSEMLTRQHQRQGSHPYQPQHLVHPQPLPPHVQRAVFTGGPAHAPMVPQAIPQQPPPHFNATVSIAAPNPQFPNIHVPTIPSQRQQAPPKLTSHSLALLNAFKSRDDTNGDTVSGDLPLRRFTQAPQQNPLPHSQPQELPAETSQAASAQTPQNFGMQNLAHALNHVAVLPRPPISDSHRSTLLDILKSPTVRAAIPAQPLAATALPTSTTPSAVELSAIEPHSANPPFENNAIIQNTKNGTPLEMNPETQLPFRATKILTRPRENRDRENHSRNGSANDRRTNVRESLGNGRPQPMQRPEKSFQPQILKRPQSNSSKPLGYHATNSPKLSQTPPQPPLDPRNPQSSQHKQTLLSLFGKAAIASPVITMSRTQSKEGQPPLQRIDPTITLSTQSPPVVIASEIEAPRSSQTPISPANQRFLLSYLDEITNSSLR